MAPKPTKNNWWITATSGDNFANDFPKENHGIISVKEAFNWTKKEVSAVSAKSLGRLQVPELIGKGDTVLTILK